MKPKMHKKQCPECKEYFVTDRGLQKVCSPTCAIERTRRKNAESRAKVKARRLRELKDSVKTRGERAREAQAAFNRYIRLRDKHLGCVSCEKPWDWNGQWHASHYRSVGAAPQLRFNTRNVHKACSVCNNHLSGNIMTYRPELIKRIGEPQVVALESNNDRASFRDEYLIRIKRIFSKKARILEKRQNDMQR